MEQQSLWGEVIRSFHGLDRNGWDTLIYLPADLCGKPSPIYLFLSHFMKIQVGNDKQETFGLKNGLGTEL